MDIVEMRASEAPELNTQASDIERSYGGRQHTRSSKIMKSTTSPWLNHSM